MRRGYLGDEERAQRWKRAENNMKREKRREFRRRDREEDEEEGR